MYFTKMFSRHLPQKLKMYEECPLEERDLKFNFILRTTSFTLPYEIRNNAGIKKFLFVSKIKDCKNLHKQFMHRKSTIIYIRIKDTIHK